MLMMRWTGKILKSGLTTNQCFAQTKSECEEWVRALEANKAFGPLGSYTVTYEEIIPSYKDQRREEFAPLDPERDEATIERLQGRPGKWIGYVAKRQAIKDKYPKPAGTPAEVETVIEKAVRLFGNMVTPQYYMIARLEMESGNDSMWKDMEKRYKKLLQDNGINSKDLVVK